MKIRITHIPNTYNYGSAMMAVSLIKGLTELLPEIKIDYYTDVSSDADLERLKSSTGINNIFKYNDSTDRQWHEYGTYEKVVKLPGKIRKIKNKLDRIINEFDASIILGGDDFSEYYGTAHVVLELLKVKYLSNRMPVYLAGQTIGPFTSYRALLAGWSLQNTRIYSRDQICFNYLRNTLGLIKVMNSRDLAFLDIPHQGDGMAAGTIMQKYGLHNGSYLTIVPSGLVDSYTKHEDSYVNAFVSIITEVLQCEPRIEKVLLLPHVFSPKGPEDSIMIEKVVAKISSNLLDKLVIIKESMLPYEARILLGGGLLTITGRMHAAVSTYQMKKPAICLSYSVKYKGVISDGLGMDKLVLECANDEIWCSGDVVTEITERVKYILNNYDSLISRINESSEKAKRYAFAQLEDIASHLRTIIRTGTNYIEK